MEASFNNYGVKLSYKDDIVLIEKQNFCKEMKMSYEQTKHCLLVLGDTKTKCITILSYLQTIDNNEEYESFVNDFIKANEQNNFTLNNHNKLTSADGRELNVMLLTQKESGIIAILTCLNNHIFIATTKYENGQYKNELDFALNVMKGLSKID